MRKLLFLLMASTGLFLLPASAHAYCDDAPPPLTPGVTGHVCGTMDWIGYNGTNFISKPAPRSYVKICPAGSTSESYYCRTTTSNNHVYNGSSYQSFIFGEYAKYFTRYSYYDLYAWSYDSNYSLGSSTRPVSQVRIGPYGYEGITLSMLPRALPPNPIYPSGSNVPSSYTVTWNSGIDQDRQPYPVTYEVWYKYWPFGAEEPSEWSLSDSNMPCHDNGSGPVPGQPCSTYVAGPQPAGNWKWYVAANLDVSRFSVFYNTIFRTESGWISFTQPQ